MVRGGRGRRAAAGISGIAALLAGTAAMAQSTRTVVLEYSRGAGAETCPDEQAVRRAVTDRLGYDPFRSEAAAVVTASITRVRRGFRADVTLGDGTGKIEGARQLASPENDCAELAQAMALAISIAVDPMSATRQPAAPEIAPAPSPSPPPPPTPTVAPAPRGPTPRPAARLVAARSPTTRQPFALRASAGGVIGVGTAPDVSVGLALQLGARRGWLSLGLEGRADLPASDPDQPGVTASLLLLSIAPCAHRGVLVACALGSLGSLRGRAAGEGSDDTIFGSAGVRAGLEVPVTTAVSARVHGDLAATLTPTTLRLDGKEIWSTPPVWTVFGVAAQAHFP